MSTAAIATAVSFTFNDPKSDSPIYITVRYKESLHIIANNDVPVVVYVDQGPPIQNALLSMIFRDDYYPLPLYCDGLKMGVSLLAGDGEPSILVPFHYGIETAVTIYPIDPDRLPGEARIVINPPLGDMGIGLLIVGTSGLWEGEN
ncbi:MAG TPA: hypothetical protein VK826_07560 [Bacteroidia bacterium]|nr:hypothetical protein [Bacteroidia bacterium]